MSKYEREFSGVLDIYEVCNLYGLQDPALFQAVKKLLRNGSGPKSKKKDVEEAILCLERWLDLQSEEDIIAYLSGDRDDVYTALSQLPTGEINEIMEDLSRSVGIDTPHVIPGFSDAKKLAKFVDSISDKVLSELQMIIDSRNTESKTEEKEVPDIVLQMNNIIEKRYRQFANAIRSQKQVKLPNPPLPQKEGQTLENITEWWEKLDEEQKEEATRLFKWHKNK